MLARARIPSTPCQRGPISGFHFFLRLLCGLIPNFLSISSAALLITTAIAMESPGKDTSGDSLATLVQDASPWLHPAANSEQRQPFYVGSTPREIALGLKPEDEGKAVLYETLRELGAAQAKVIRVALAEMGKIQPGDTLELEGWPMVDQQCGALTWVFARWRTEKTPFKWLDSAEMQDKVFPRTAPMLPTFMDLRNKENFSNVFDDVLEMKSLYDKPNFGECLWTTVEEKDSFPSEAWLPIDEREDYGKTVAANLPSTSAACRTLSQPARLNGKPITFVLTVTDNGEVVWPENIRWKAEPDTLPENSPAPARITVWPTDFTRSFQNDVLALDGEKEAVFPLSQKKATFLKKNNIQKDNQLLDLVAYLEERYRAMGIPTVRQEFQWRGLPHANLIAKIPGSDPAALPVLMADHIDAAFCEDTYEATGERVSAPGADDNISATATLLRAADMLKGMKPRHDIWLVHLTGEEFPADDLGARHLVGKLLEEKKDIAGLVLLDMIGYREKGDPVFQINPGDSQASMNLAKISMDAAKRITDLKAVLRPRFDPRSYLYNTDGIIFSETGFPVVYLNEHMNRLENFWRKGYHHTTDNSKKMDWEYASDIAKVAIETVAVLAEAEPATGK